MKMSLVGKMPIAEYKKSEDRIYLRIKRDIHTQKHYNRFKNAVRHRFTLSGSGSGEHSIFYGGRDLFSKVDFEVHLVKTAGYFHMIIIFTPSSKSLLEFFSKAIAEHFNYIHKNKS